MHLCQQITWHAGNTACGSGTTDTCRHIYICFQSLSDSPCKLWCATCGALHLYAEDQTHREPKRQVVLPVHHKRKFTMPFCRWLTT